MSSEYNVTMEKRREMLEKHYPMIAMQVEQLRLKQETSPSSPPRLPDFSRTQISPEPPRSPSPAPSYHSQRHQQLPDYGKSSKDKKFCVSNARMQWLLTKPDYGTVSFHLCDSCRNDLYRDKNKIFIEEDGVTIIIKLCPECAETEINSKLYYFENFKNQRAGYQQPQSKL